MRADCLTIDETHCISDWGHDFRPEYRNRRKLKGVVTIALTATATARVREDIREQLAITEGNEFIASFDHPNLQLNVLANGHETLSTYGIRRELEKNEWLALARQLVQQSLLRQDAEYGTLALAQPAIPLLKGEMKFLGRATPPQRLPLLRGAAGLPPRQRVPNSRDLQVKQAT